MISKYVLANIVTPLAYIRILRVIDLETSMPNYDKPYAAQFKKNIWWVLLWVQIFYFLFCKL